MKLFKSIREAYSVEPGVTEIDDVQDDPLSFVEIKPKKTKVVKEAMSKDDMSSVALQSMVAKKNLKQTAGKNKSQAFVDKMVSKANAGDRLPRRPNDEYDRKVTTYLKKKYNEEVEQIDELNRDTVTSYAARAEKDVDKRHKDLTSQIKSNSPLSANKTADKIIKRYSGMDRAENRLNKEETEQMDEKLTSKDIKMAVGVAKDKRYAGGNMSGAVKTMEKMKPGLSKHPRVQKVLKSTQEGIEEEYEDSGEEHPMMYKHVSSVNSNTWSGTAKHHGKNLPKVVQDLEKERDSIKKKGGSKNATSNHDHAIMQLKQHLPSTNEGIDFLKIWNGIKPVHEEVKTTHEDPLVLTKDAEGHIHTHANLSVANAIHGTDVKHQAIHTGKPVQAGKFTFELSKHHEGALKEDAPFDPVAHKKELDQLMGKHMAAHTQTTKLINAKAPQEQINKAQERNNAVKAEIRAHKDKVPKGPAPKPGSAADYYASKKPGEYTGD